MLRRLSLSLLLLAFACLTAAPAAHAQGRPPGKAYPQAERERDRDRDEDRDRDRRQKGVPVFTARDRDIIREFFRGGYSNLPPGLAKRGNLPPGLQKHIERNGTLPPGLQKRLTPFPLDLERRLSSISGIYRRGTIGETVVLIDRRTQRVIDVIYDILRP